MINRLALILAIALAAISGYFLSKSFRNTQRLEGELAAARAHLERASEELQKARAAQVAQPELDRLRADQREALKLRAEVTRLKQDLATAQSANKMANEKSGTSNAKSPAQALVTPSLPEDDPDVAVHQTRVIETTVPSTSVLAVGGWESVSGKRLYAFMQPSQDKLNGEQVGIATVWIEINDEAAKSLKVGNFLDTSGEQFTTLDGDAFKRFKEQLEKTTGADVLTAPTITTVSGRQARVNVSETRHTRSGKVEFGPNVDVIPVVAQDGSGINVTMKASMVERRAPAN